MSYLVIYEETEEVVELDKQPPANNYPTYTILYNTKSSKWYRCHKLSMKARGNTWFPIEPQDEPEIPKSVRAMVLLLS
jgi:hypothetical protein